MSLVLPFLEVPQVLQSKTKCTIFPPSKPDHSLIYPISLNWDRILHAILDRVIFDSPTPHPITQRGFSSFLPITCLILLFHCYHYCLGSYIYVIFCLGLLIFVTKHPPEAYQPPLTTPLSSCLASIQKLEGSPLLQNHIPVPSQSHLGLLFHSYFLLFLKINPLLEPAWCTACLHPTPKHLIVN